MATEFRGASLFLLFPPDFLCFYYMLLCRTCCRYPPSGDERSPYFPLSIFRPRWAGPYRRPITSTTSPFPFSYWDFPVPLLSFPPSSNDVPSSGGRLGRARIESPQFLRGLSGISLLSYPSSRTTSILYSSVMIFFFFSDLCSSFFYAFQVGHHFFPTTLL